MRRHNQGIQPQKWAMIALKNGIGIDDWCMHTMPESSPEFISFRRQCEGSTNNQSI